MISRIVCRHVLATRRQLASTILKFSSVATNHLPENLVTNFKSIVGQENVSLAQAVREQHGKDEGHFSPALPDLVVFPTETKQVSQIVKLCYDNEVPIVPFGTGTGIEGGTTAIHGGVCIDVGKMNQVLEVNEADFDCTVQAGVTWRDLNQYLHGTGLYFPVDPGASASLGGMSATSASGTNAVRFGTMKDNVLNLQVVLPDGQIIKTGGKTTRTRKSSAGLNLTNFFVGSEGLLGIITEVTLKLHPIPNSIAVAICPFETVKGAIDTVIELLQCGVPVARVEFIDTMAMKACKSYSKIDDIPEMPSLFIELYGSTMEEIEPHINQVKEIAKGNEVREDLFRWSAEPEQRSRIWKARHDLYYASLALRKGCKAWTTDVCVPISSLTDMVLKNQELIDKAGITGTQVGHVGDGNLHVALIADPNDLQEVKRAQDFELESTRYALSLGGTCTGEHGIGRGKITLLREQFDDGAIDLMRRLKLAIDPKNLMNPGKVIN